MKSNGIFHVDSTFFIRILVSSKCILCHHIAARTHEGDTFTVQRMRFKQFLFLILCTSLCWWRWLQSVLRVNVERYYVFSDWSPRDFVVARPCVIEQSSHFCTFFRSFAMRAKLFDDRQTEKTGKYAERLTFLSHCFFFLFIRSVSSLRQASTKPTPFRFSFLLSLTSVLSHRLSSVVVCAPL